MRSHLEFDPSLYGELFERKKDRFKAQENLSRAIEFPKEFRANGWMSKYEK